MLTIRYREPVTGRVFLGPPGGEIEEGESPERAAEREVLEETGYRALLLPEPRFSSRYAFDWAGKTYECRTNWFPARLLEPGAPPLAPEEVEYITGVVWLPLERAESEFSYHAIIRKDILRVLSGMRDFFSSL